MALVVYLAILFIVSVIPVSGPKTTLPVDKAEHFAAYGLAAVLFVRYFSKRHYRYVFWYAVLAASAYGLLLEGVQDFVPYRKFSLADAGANMAGALIIGAAYALRRKR